MSVSGLEYIDMGLGEVTGWDGDSTVLPPGNYTFRITKIEGGTSRAGKPKMTLNLMVVEAHEEVEENQAVVGESILQSYSLNKSQDVVRRRMRALTDACEITIDERGGFDPRAMIDVCFDATVKHETWEDRDPVTEAVTEKFSMRIFRERPTQYVDDDASDDAEPEPVPEPEPSKAAKAPKSGRNSRGNPRGSRRPTR